MGLITSHIAHSFSGARRADGSYKQVQEHIIPPPEERGLAPGGNEKRLAHGAEEHEPLIHKPVVHKVRRKPVCRNPSFRIAERAYTCSEPACGYATADPAVLLLHKRLEHEAEGSADWEWKERRERRRELGPARMREERSRMPTLPKTMDMSKRRAIMV